MIIKDVLPVLSYIQPIVISDFHHKLYYGNKCSVPDWLLSAEVAIIYYSKYYKSNVIYVQKSSKNA